MKTLLAAAVLCTASASADDWVALFDGKTLEGWQGDPAIWSVEDGEIVGRTTPETNRTTYLHRDGVFDDFELEFDIKLEGAGAQPKGELDVYATIAVLVLSSHVVLTKIVEAFV